MADKALTMDGDGQLPGTARTRIANNIRNAASVEGDAVRDIAAEVADEAVQKIGRGTAITPIEGRPFYGRITN